MKRILYLIFMASILSLHSCVKDEENIFDSSSSERMAEALTEYDSILTEAPNGWVMSYYPEEDHSIGGYVFLCSFNSDGEVTVASEITTDNYEPGDQVTSLYKLISDEGPVLSFDTYNEIFHYFSEPSSSDVDGYSGDYEFVFTSVSSDSIIMKGKKYENKIIMTPLEEGVDWGEYIQKILDIEESSAFGTYNLFLNNSQEDTVATVTQSGRAFEFEYADGDEKTTEQVSFIYTTTGIRFYEPFSIDGVTMENFDWDSNNSTFVCTDSNVTATIVVDLPENYLYYSDYIGTWTFSYYYGTTAVTVSEKVKNKTLLVSGLDFDFIMNYDPATGTVDIVTQDVGTYNGYIIRLCPWDTSAGYYTWGSGCGLVSTWSEDEDNFELTFSDNGVWGSYTATGLLFRQFTSSGSAAGNYSGGTYRFRNISMVKQ